MSLNVREVKRRESCRPGIMSLWMPKPCASEHLFSMIYWERGGAIELHHIQGICSHYVDGFSIKLNLIKVLFVCYGPPQHICKRSLASTLVFINRVSYSQTLCLLVLSSPFLLFLHRITQSCCQELSEEPSVSGWLQPMWSWWLLIVSAAQVKVGWELLTFPKSHHQLNFAAYTNIF